MKKGFLLLKKLDHVIELIDYIEVDLELLLKSKSIILASQSNISEKNVKLSIDGELLETLAITRANSMFVCLDLNNYEVSAWI